MPKQTAPISTKLSRPAKRPKTNKGTKQRKGAGRLKAFVGPRTLRPALDHAVPARRSNSRLRVRARKMGVGAREFLRFATL
jgi:hypothetical protein